MRKYIIPVLCLLITAFFIVYASIKANEASRLVTLAERATLLAEQNTQDARRQAEISLLATADAKRQQNRADALTRELEQCQTRKK